MDNKPTDKGEWVSVEEKYLRNLISMVCDQFGAGFAGRDEFITKTIDEWKKSLPSQPQEVGQDELWEIIKEDINSADKAYVPLKLIVKWKKQFTLI